MFLKFFDGGVSRGHLSELNFALDFRASRLQYFNFKIETKFNEQLMNQVLGKTA